MRRNITLRNSIDTESSVSTYSSCVRNECNNEGQNSSRSIESTKPIVVQKPMVMVKNFGEANDNHGWIECTSTSLPGRSYYYNLRSYCTTWQRPLSRAVQIPKYSLTARNFGSESLCGLSLAALSGEEKDNKGVLNDSAIASHKSTLTRQRFAEILSQLYYCPPIHSSENETMDYTNKACNFNINSNRSTLCTTDKVKKKSLYDETVSVSSDNSSVILPTDFLQTQLDCLSRCASPTAVVNEKSLIISDKDTESTDSKNDKYKCQGPSKLRLKEINVADLSENFHVKGKMIRKGKKPRQRNYSRKPKCSNKPRKIICDAYGIRTINYDPVVSELPPGVRKTNLSDTSDASFTTCVEKQTKETMPNTFMDSNLQLNINAPSLSESSSFCSCNS